MSDSDRPLIFISCGQANQEEKALGQELAQLVDSLTECQGYFALNQQSLLGVFENILDALNNCVGFIGVMHDRGQVSNPQGTHVRGSVWVEQEIAIASFLAYTLSRQIPVAVYVHEGIKREGLRDQLQLNPVEFRDHSDVIRDLRTKLESGLFQPVDFQRTRSLESPLGDVTEEVAIDRKPSSNEFFFGIRIRPKYYERSVRVLDSEDDSFFVGVYSELSSLCQEQLHLERKAHGILFATEAPPPNSTEVKPNRQIYIQSDGKVIVKFSQGTGDPIPEWMSMLTVAFRFAQEALLRFGLRPNAIATVESYLHAGRKKYVPSLPMFHSDTFEVDFSKSTFAEAFKATVMVALRKEGTATESKGVVRMLSAFAEGRAPRLLRIDERWRSEKHDAVQS